MKKLAIAGIIAAGALGAIVSNVPVESPREKIPHRPIVLNKASIEIEQSIQKGAESKYVQVTKDGRQLIGNKSVQSDLINLIPKNAEVYVYDGPCGDGYQVIEHNATSTISTGFGCEADARTYVHIISTSTATST